MVFFFLILRYKNKMATDKGWMAERNDFKLHSKKPTPVSFVLDCKNWLIRIRMSPIFFIMGHLCFFWHCVTVTNLSHVTERHSIYLFKLPVLEAEDSSNTLLVPYWCHLVSGSALIIFHLSSNSPQTDCCSIITIISFYLSCFLYKFPQLCVLPFHLYESVYYTNDYHFTYRLGVAHFSMLKALKILIFSYSLFCVLILIPP